MNLEHDLRRMWPSLGTLTHREVEWIALPQHSDSRMAKVAECEDFHSKLTQVIRAVADDDENELIAIDRLSPPKVIRNAKIRMAVRAMGSPKIHSKNGSSRRYLSCILDAMAFVSLVE